MKNLDSLQLLLKVFRIVQPLNKGHCLSTKWSNILRSMNILLQYNIYTGQKILLEPHIRIKCTNNAKHLRK